MNDAIPLLRWVRDNLTTYGKQVVEQRSLADYRDGLKPGQRRIVYAMKELGLTRNLAKSAKVVGAVMGSYHPHGDAAIYSTMVTMANLSNRIIHGEGSWGWFNAPEPAAMRYTEARLTKYAAGNFLDADYLHVSEFVPNFDDSIQEPLWLPSLLPNLLLNGTSGIAYGVAAGIPPFEPNGVMALVRRVLSGKKVTPKHCLKYLRFNYPYGGRCLSGDAALLDYFRTGSGSIRFGPEYTVVPKERKIVITSLPPNFSLDKATAKMLDYAEVAQFNDLSAITKAKPDGEIRLEIRLKTSIDVFDVNAWAEKLTADLATSVTCITNVTERKRQEVKVGDNVVVEHHAEFLSTTIPELVSRWTEWRVGLEVDVLTYRLSVVEKEIANLSLFLRAIKYMDEIFRILKTEKTDLEARVAKVMGISRNEAKIILDRQVRSLSNLNARDLRSRRKAAKTRAAEIKSWIKCPRKKILADLERHNALIS